METMGSDEATATPTITEENKLLIENVEELKISNGFLREEHAMLEAFIRRQGPQETAPHGPHEMAPQPPGDPAMAEGSPQPARHLDLRQKIYIAQKEMEETKRDIKEAQRRNEIDKAVMEEAELRLSEIRRQKFEFERDVVKPLEENKGQMDMEKVLGYIEDGIKRKEAQVEKHCLKNKSKVRGRKPQLKLQQDQDMDEDLKEVNMALLKIKNSQHKEKTAECKRELLIPKQRAFTAQRNLSSYKNKLQNATLESEELSRDITKRQETLAKIEEETQRVEKECAKEKALCERLRFQLDDCSVPDVMEYIQVKDRHKRLQRTFHVWERKVELSERALRSYTKAWKREKADVASVDHTEARASPGHPMAVLRLPKIN
ncbi:unnamed protein product [Gadus morhua 'NCC']